MKSPVRAPDRAMRSGNGATTRPVDKVSPAPHISPTTAASLAPPHKSMSPTRGGRNTRTLMKRIKLPSAARLVLDYLFGQYHNSKAVSSRCGCQEVQPRHGPSVFVSSHVSHVPGAFELCLLAEASSILRYNRSLYTLQTPPMPLMAACVCSSSVIQWLPTIGA